MQNSFQSLPNGGHADSHASAAADLPAARTEQQQRGSTRAGIYTNYGGGLTGHMQLAGPTSEIDSPAVSEVMVLDASNPQQRAQYRRQSPSPDGEDEFGQYTSDSAAAQRSAARQHAGQGMNQQAMGPHSADADADTAPTSLPPPAFDLMHQPAAPRSGSVQDPEAFVQQLRMQLQSSLQAAAAQDASTGQNSSAQPQHSQAPAPAQAAAGFQPAPARRDHASELTQLLSDLPTDEVLAVLRQLKAGNSPDSHGPMQRRQESPPAPHQQQQHQQPFQQQQQGRGVRRHGLPPSAASAPNGGGYQQRMPLLPPTLSAPVGPGSQNQGLAAAYAAAASAAPWAQQEGPGADMQPGPLGPYRQQRLAPPRFIPEAHHGSSMQDTPLAEQLQRILQQQQPAQPPMQQQRIVEPSVMAVPQYQQRQQQQVFQSMGSYHQQQSIQLPPQQQQQQQAGYREARPAHVQVPPAPAQPDMPPTAADILQVMQRLVGASQGGNGGVGPPAASASQPPAPPPPAADPGLQHGGSVFEVALQGIAQVLQGSLGPPPPAPPAAAAPPPPPPVSGSGVDIAALMQQLLSGKQEQQQQQPMQAPQAVVPAPPAAAAAGPGLGLSGFGDAFGAVVASAIAGITEGFGNGQGQTSPGSQRLIDAANSLLAALNAAQGDPTAAAAAGDAYGQEEEAFDPVAAAAAPRDYLPVKKQQHSSSGRPGDWQAAGYGAGEGEERGWGRSSHAGGRDEGSGYAYEQAYTAGGSKRTSLPSRRKARGRSARDKGPAPSHGNNNLFALLAALEQQESQDFAATAEADFHHGDEGYGYDTAAAAAAAAAERGGWGGADSEQERAQSSPGEEAPAGFAGGAHTWQGRRGPKAEQQKRRTAAALAAALKARRKRAGGPVDPEPGINVLTTDQRWLLQRREGGKRPVKPNETFSAYVAPVLPHEVHAQHKRGRGHKAQHGDGKGLGYNPQDAAAMAAMPSTFIDGPNHPRRRLIRRRTSYGWYLLGKGRLQEDEGEVDAAAAAAEAGDKHAAPWQYSAQQQQQQREEEDAAQLSGSSGAVAGAAAESSPVVSASAAAGAGEPVAFESLSEAAMAAAAAEAAVQDQDVKQAQYESGLGDVDMTEASISTAAAAVPSAAAAAAAAGGGRKQRWVAGDNQWVTPDGVTVWPRDNEVTVDQRVFYVAYKWVHKYWLHRVGRGDPHVITLPAAFWVEGQPVDLVLSAKIRMYNKAAHMLLTPYASLAKHHAGLWFVGYGYDARNKVIRCYLSRDKPEQIKSGVAGHRGGRFVAGKSRSGKSTKAAAAAAAAASAPVTVAEGVTMSASVAAPGPKQEPMDASTEGTAAAAAAAGIGAAGAAAAAGSGVVQQRSAGSTLSGKKRRKQQGPAVVGSVPADVLMEAVAHADHTAEPPAAAAAGEAVTPAAAAAAAENLGDLKPDLKVLITHSAASEPAVIGDQQQQQQQQQPRKRGRPSRSAAAGVAAAAIAAGAGGSPRSGATQEEADPAVLKALLRSANGKAAVARRWAKYRQEKAGQDTSTLQVQAAPAPPPPPPAAAAAAAAATEHDSGNRQQEQQQASPKKQKPALRLPELVGREFAADIGTISTALLSVSDSMKLPEDLLVGLSRQLVKTLQDAAAAGGTGSVGGKEDADRPAGGAGGVKEGGEGGMQLHACVKGWYGELCGAVSKRNGALVAQLVEDLGSKVLAPAS